MNFKRWIIFNENIEENWDLWCDTLEKYSENNPSEKRVLNSLKDRWNWSRSVQSGPAPTLKDILNKKTPLFNMIKRVLKEKNIENYNWFCFSLGCVLAYDGIHEEDLRSSIDEVRRRISSRELPKSEIGTKGWLVIGSESKQYVDEAIIKSQTLSKRQQEKLRKTGRTLEDDPGLIKIFAEEGDFTLYFCPALPPISLSPHGSLQSALKRATNNHQNLIDQRHAILCKYGKGGSFCTASPTGTFHRDYIRNDIYIFHVNDKVKYQFVSCEDSRNKQFMTVENRPPDEIEKEEKDFLIKYNAPIECYNLKTPVASYSDLLRAAKNPEKDWSINIFKEASIATIERYLDTALKTGKEEDILLLFKSGLFVSRNSVGTRSRSQLNLKSFIDKLKDYSFAQEIIKEIINFLSTDHILQYLVDNKTIESIVQISDLDNLKLFFFKISRSGNILSKPEYFNIIKKYKNNEELIEILAETNNPPAAILIAIHKDKQKICNILRTNDKLKFLTKMEIVDLLLGSLRTVYGQWNTKGTREISIPEIKTGVSGKEMASALGSKVITSIPLPSQIVLGLYSKINAKIPDNPLFFDIDVSKDQARELIEIIASKHENLDNEDIRNIITAYKGLGIHKAMEKISKLLGSKNMKKLKREDRYLV